MGTWSATIMGSDLTLDIAGVMYDKFELDEETSFEINELDQDTKNTILNNLSNKQNEVYDWLKSQFEDLEDQNYIWLVLAYFSLGLGAVINEDVKVKMIEATTKDSAAEYNDDEDEFTKDRKKVMQTLAEALMSYTAEKPVILTNEGLLEALSNK